MELDQNKRLESQAHLHFTGYRAARCRIQGLQAARLQTLQQAGLQQRAIVVDMAWLALHKQQDALGKAAQVSENGGNQDEDAGRRVATILRPTRRWQPETMKQTRKALMPLDRMAPLTLWSSTRKQLETRLTKSYELAAMASQSSAQEVVNPAMRLMGCMKT